MVLYYVIPIALLVILFLRQKFSFFRNLGVPQNTQWSPMGDTWDIGFRVNFFHKIDVMYKKFKSQAPAFGFYAFTTPILMATDPDLLRAILVKDFANFVDRGVYNDEAADPLTCHLFAIDGKKWQRMRNALSPTFTSGKMKGMFHIIEEKGKDLVDYFKRNPSGVEMKEANARFTADVVASTAFGLETRSLYEDKPVILDILRNIFGTSAKDAFYFMFLTSFPSFSAKLKLRQFGKDIEEFFASTIRNTIEYRASNNIKRSDFLNMLINLMERGSIADSGEVNAEGKLSFNEILAQAFVFFAAGYETSSTGMAYAMYFLAKYPEVQKKVREEVTRVKGKHGGQITYEALMEMTYLNQVFNETLRLYPPVSVLIRKCLSDYKVAGSSIVIPKNTLVEIPVYSVHRDPEHYPKPEVFDPDRFRQEEVAKRHPYVFIPFGDGPRNCIGMRFAQLQAKYGLAVVVENFELTVNPRVIEPIELDKSTPNLNAKGGLWIDFKSI